MPCIENFKEIELQHRTETLQISTLQITQRLHFKCEQCTFAVCPCRATETCHSAQKYEKALVKTYFFSPRRVKVQ